jgi:hypothetical protein
MTEETVMVTCALTGEQIEEKNAAHLTMEGKEKVYADQNAVFHLIDQSMLGILLGSIASNQKLMERVLVMQESIAARNVGIQEGATKVVNSLREACSKLDIDPENLLKTMFPEEEDLQANG